MTPVRAFWLLVGVWSLATADGLAPLLTWGRYEFIAARSVCATAWGASVAYSYASFLACFVVPFLVFAVCYGKMFLIAWAQQRKVAAITVAVAAPRSQPTERQATNSVKSGRNARIAKQEKKGAVTLFIIVGVFVICVTPSYVVAIWAADHGNSDGAALYPMAIASLLSLANSALNPFIYGTLNRQYRQRFVNLWRCQYKRTYSMSNLSAEQTARAAVRKMRRADDSSASVDSDDILEIRGAKRRGLGVPQATQVPLKLVAPLPLVLANRRLNRLRSRQKTVVTSNASGSTPTLTSPSTAGTRSTRSPPFTLSTSSTLDTPPTLYNNSTSSPATLDTPSMQGIPSALRTTSTLGIPSTLSTVSVANSSIVGTPSTNGTSSLLGTPSTLHDPPILGTRSKARYPFKPQYPAYPSHPCYP